MSGLDLDYFVYDEQCPPCVDHAHFLVLLLLWFQLWAVWIHLCLPFYCPVLHLALAGSMTLYVIFAETSKVFPGQLVLPIMSWLFSSQWDMPRPTLQGGLWESTHSICYLYSTSPLGWVSHSICKRTYGHRWRYRYSPKPPHACLHTAPGNTKCLCDCDTVQFRFLHLFREEVNQYNEIKIRFEPINNQIKCFQSSRKP